MYLASTRTEEVISDVMEWSGVYGAERRRGVIYIVLETFHIKLMSEF